METATPVKPDPQVELMEAKRAISVFCFQLENFAIAAGASKPILDAIIKSDLYQEMKLKATTI